MAGGEPRLGTTATYMRHNDHGTTRLSTEIDILHDLINDEYRVFSAGSVRKWSKFGLELRGSRVRPLPDRPTNRWGSIRHRSHANDPGIPGRPRLSRRAGQGFRHRPAVGATP